MIPKERSRSASITYELSTPLGKPWIDPDAVRHRPAIPNVNSRIGVNLLPELFLVGRLRGRVVPGGDRYCNLGKEKERIALYSLSLTQIYVTFHPTILA